VFLIMGTSSTHFFYSQAGWSFTPTVETSSQGRWRGARQLAKAERHAKAQGWSCHWEEDASSDSSDFSDETPAWGLWVCILKDAEGNTLDVLGGVDFGRDANPGGPYKRVVEAELALEASR
jgi:hypothetical protein